MELIIILAVLLIFVLLVAAIGLALFFVLRRSAPASRPQAEQRVPCPYCAELILPGAKICRFCGRELPARSEGGLPK
jgi:hypothetical protein